MSLFSVLLALFLSCSSEWRRRKTKNLLAYGKFGKLIIKKEQPGLEKIALFLRFSSEFNIQCR